MAPFSLSLLVASALALTSCTAPAPVEATAEEEVAATTKTAPKVVWMFDGHIVDDLPAFDIYLEIDGEFHPVVDNTETEYRELDPGEGKHWGIPANRLTACTSWWAGKGDVIYVMDEGGKLGVYRALLEEGADITPFKRIKTIAY